MIYQILNFRFEFHFHKCQCFLKKYLNLVPEKNENKKVIFIRCNFLFKQKIINVYEFMILEVVEGLVK